MSSVRWPALAGLLTGGAVAVAASARILWDRGVRALWTELALEGRGETFDPAVIARLPAPARRFLLRAIQPGAPLARSVELRMHGEIRLAPDRDPTPMRAEQILAPPEGFIWRARTVGGPMRIQGFDRYARGQGEMRWLLWGLVPVARATGSDVTRSAAGRLAMEAVLLPSSLLPGRGFTWEEVDDTRARFSTTVGPETVVTTLEVDAEGRPRRASARRWSDAAGPGYARFVVDFDGELESGGYRIPSRIEARWHFGPGTDFRFFQATLEQAVFR